MKLVLFLRDLLGNQFLHAFFKLLRFSFSFLLSRLDAGQIGELPIERCILFFELRNLRF